MVACTSTGTVTYSHFVMLGDSTRRRLRVGAVQPDRRDDPRRRAARRRAPLRRPRRRPGRRTPAPRGRRGRGRWWSTCTAASGARSTTAPTPGRSPKALVGGRVRRRDGGVPPRPGRLAGHRRRPRRGADRAAGAARRDLGVRDHHDHPRRALRRRAPRAVAGQPAAPRSTGWWRSPRSATSARPPSTAWAPARPWTSSAARPSRSPSVYDAADPATRMRDRPAVARRRRARRPRRGTSPSRAAAGCRPGSTGSTTASCADVDHFDVIDPLSPAWPAVLDAVRG